jgi:nucleotide-binding universal stress UspA family protein
MVAVIPSIRVPINKGQAGAGEDVARLREKMWRTYQEVLTDAEYRVRSEHPEIRILKFVKEGQPSDIIVEVAESDNTDLIVIGSSGIGGVKCSILGSTCRRVAKSCTKPVLIVK